MAVLINHPDLWRAQLPVPGHDGHKYHRGHAVILGAPELTGATRLAATACARIGAGLVTVLAAAQADIYRTTLPADIMVRDDVLKDISNVTSILAGPGGVSSAHTAQFLADSSEVTRIVDADALQFDRLELLLGDKIFTPHEGEFSRMFGDMTGHKQERAGKAAVQTGAIMVLKGAETMISHPDGRTVTNDHASPYLAKAGTGDVLSGMICGLVAQGMEPFEATCAAVWMHGEAGRRLGPGLMAQDIEAKLPEILRDLLS